MDVDGAPLGLAHELGHVVGGLLQVVEPRSVALSLAGAEEEEPLARVGVDAHLRDGLADALVHHLDRPESGRM